MTDKIFTGVWIPYRGPLKIIRVILKEIDSLLECDISPEYGKLPEHKKSAGSNVEYLEYFGFQPTMFHQYKDSAGSLPFNVMASLILKERGPILGNALLLDDGKDLNVDDFRKIIEIAKVIPSIRWVPAPILNRMLVDPSESKYINGIIKSMKLASGTDEQRIEIWNKIGKYYIPRPEDTEE
ncbi:Hypothetical protein HVR_LOCUS987 [uncultured virus]|nr:Hypothetical protein HVR_LOCUS987 [uncultured virus]